MVLILKKKLIMKKSILIFLMLLNFGCNTKPRERPFVIVLKNVYTDSSPIRYVYQDKNGLKAEFTDHEVYNVGDIV